MKLSKDCEITLRLMKRRSCSRQKTVKTKTFSTLRVLLLAAFIFAKSDILK